MMTPRNIGPYDLIEELGRGGMGVVYHARHREGGGEVALKTVNADHARRMRSIHREIRLLSTLEHPGVTRVLDFGVDAGRPWYVMEFVQGVSLRQTWQRLGGAPPSSATSDGTESLSRHGRGEPCWTRTLSELSGVFGRPAPERPLTLEPLSVDLHTGELPVAELFEQISAHESPALELLLQLLPGLCATLAYLHGRGVVHRDLKPENILIRTDGQPVLVDFGLSAKHRREDLHRERAALPMHRSGTPRYMAPEQIRGATVDGRADLYALGCILYEAAAGRPPFVGALTDVLRQHLGSAPAPLPHISTRLQEVIRSLLAKPPIERIGHAMTVLRRLVPDARNPWPAHELQPCLYRPPLCGRGPELLALSEALEAAASGSGSALLLTGPPGCGKTRLALEVARVALERDDAVIVVDGVTSQEPFACLEPLLEHLVASLTEAATHALHDTLYSEHLDALALISPAFRALIGERSAPDHLKVDEGQRVLFRAVDALLEAATRASPPLLLVIDELNALDSLSHAWIQHRVELGLAALPVLLIATETAAAEGFESLHVGEPLSEDALEALVAGMLSASPPPQLMRFLREHAAGNPLLAAEYVRTALRRGLLRQDTWGRWSLVDARVDFSRLALPRALHALVSEYLDALGPDAQRLLTCAAILGRGFSLDALLSVCRADGLEAGAFDATLQRFIAEGVLIERGDALRFNHALMRELLEDRVDVARSRVLHRHVARDLERVSPEEHGRIARHWSAAGEDARVLPHALAGAQRALNRFAPEEATRLYHLFLELAPEDHPERVAALYNLGESHFALGELEEALITYEVAERSARASGRETLGVRARVDAVNCQATLGQTERARDHVDALSARLRALSEPPIDALIVFGVLNVRLSNLESADATLVEAIRLAQERGDEDALARALSARSSVAWHDARFQDAARFAREALTLLERLPRNQDRAFAEFRAGSAELNLGHPERALSHWDRALEIFRRLGLRRWEAIALINYAGIDLLEERYRSAIRHFESSAAILEEMNDVRTVSVCRYNLCVALTGDGQIERAEAQLTPVIETLAELSDRDYLGLAICLEVRLRRLLGQGDDLRARLEAALEVATPDTVIVIHCERAHLALLEGDPEGAREWAQKARELSQELDVAKATYIALPLDRIEAALAPSASLWRGEAVQALEAGIRARLGDG